MKSGCCLTVWVAEDATQTPNCALRRQGIEVYGIFQSDLHATQLRVNYRNHRKIVVIDGRIGFVGGFNIGREYVRKDKKFGYWRDTHICIEGSAVTSLASKIKC